ncbi:MULTISPECIES: NADP-dependent methylenetetrahydromethanopterin/methylenetetrahydrofolate dehydrogenase [Methylobacterium]|uniref:Bifunctional protein MdtA n=1 Tax=Methylobacterium jeotgali TaxID=381630 RepID=A0ABQ4SVA7_9HYPH|nr:MULTISPECIES: NADP-dependent methylenetetrahydromethanopterin/methylenetetrahydrofolate dehydrogenase [Methylobacterium]PIU07353.1 MAG: methylenetetrahydrofolate dehydrogenase [Methylobacterium sp. CG09_land_8_20_14_0_10_71_15]PIU11948.1 MAG: methylenetetrahydrofolate dehydrogenase [Methylobacterium sp. CG08_land_8_20_14_0_20_71_15]GBU16141.1 MtdA bifunctional protein [Methylobacterium sp.]GJE07140.1 Bifunctional protein MdtA [Methylobacterium jeotgali]
MKKLLFLFDTDAVPSVFDTVVGYDGGADHITGYGNVTPENVGALVDGTIYTRGGSEKKSTAIFVGGGNLVAGEAVLAAVRKRFFGPFRVSTMLDSNGSNTTAAAGVALVAKAAGSLEGKRAIVLAGTGPVGMRSAALLAKEGAEVTIAARQLARAQDAADAVNKRFNVAVKAAETPDAGSRAAAVKGQNVVFSAGAIGLELLSEDAWKDEAGIEFLADYNAQPPMGIGGLDAMDKAKERHGKRTFGALGIGGLKLKLHRACVGQLFDNTEQVLDAEEIYALAKKMA